MIVYVLRHAEAEPKGPEIKDNERQVSKNGLKTVRKILELAMGLGTEIDLIVSSPYRRAIQTAQIAKEIFLSTPRMVESDVLEPDSTPYEVSRYLSKFGISDRIMLVSHQPLVGDLIRSILGGSSNLSFPPASIARFDLKETDKFEGILVWLLSSEILREKTN